MRSSSDNLSANQHQTTVRFDSDQFANFRPYKIRWPRLLKKSDLAEYLSISERTIDAWISVGILPHATMKTSSKLKRWDKKHIDLALDSMEDAMPFNGTVQDTIARFNSMEACV